jgi:hypothetical protein
MTRPGYLVGEVFNPLGVVSDGKGFFKDMAIAVTKHNNMVFFGVIHWNTHDFCIVSGVFKKTEQFLTLVQINVFLFHGEAPPFIRS